MPRPALPKSSKRSKVIRARVTPPEYAQIRAVAGKRISEWVRSTLADAAKGKKAV